MMKDMNTSEVFVTNAGVGDLYEVAAGELAAQRASSDAVRDFGQMMVEHHTTAVHQMRAALMSREVGEALPDLTPVAALDAKRQQMLDQLLAAKDDILTACTWNSSARRTGRPRCCSTPMRCRVTTRSSGPSQQAACR